MTITPRQLAKGKCRVYLYEMGETGCYKIGVSNHPARRFSGVSLPYPIRIHAIVRCIDAYKLEAKLKLKFKSKRMNREWYRLTKDDVQFIQMLTGAVRA